MCVYLCWNVHVCASANSWENVEAKFWAAGNGPMQEQGHSVLCHLQPSPTLKKILKDILCVCVCVHVTCHSTYRGQRSGLQSSYSLPYGSLRINLELQVWHPELHWFSGQLLVLCEGGPNVELGREFAFIMFFLALVHWTLHVHLWLQAFNICSKILSSF